MSEHTPTPWTLCCEGKCPCLTISCPDHPIAKIMAGEWGNRYEAYMEREIARANARFIVKAVNEHDALLKELGEWKQAASVEAGLRREFLAQREVLAGALRKISEPLLLPVEGIGLARSLETIKAVIAIADEALAVIGETWPHWIQEKENGE